ncbi:ABC transporter permease [Paludibacter sp. 221]|uniref:ABC transporter permease n=1 Tax=Paludibacter sp. 221 TaxID=2302939 RepID=UPI0013D4AA37|nr:ABC transporter permease [Paludibacter sp. 221]NDV46200.1 ABC transporter permease [Paludibacter sp. 221]
MEQYTTVIKPKGKLWQVDFKEIWEYRDLLSMFVKRDIITQYKQTVLGPLWFLIQPILTTLMQFVVFGTIADLSTDSLPKPLFYLAGNVMWLYFADCLNKTSTTFNTNQAIFGKVYFPRLIVPLATVISNLVRFGIQLLLFVVFYLYYVFIGGYEIQPNIYILLLPVLVFMIAGLALGFGILVSSMTTKYRDLTILFTFIVQLWMYGTPVVYPMSSITNSILKTIMWFNPLTSIFEAFKYGAMGQGEFSWIMLGYSFCFMLLLLTISIIVFNSVQRSFMDTV